MSGLHGWGKKGALCRNGETEEGADCGKEASVKKGPEDMWPMKGSAKARNTGHSRASRGDALSRLVLVAWSPLLGFRNGPQKKIAVPSLHQVCLCSRLKYWQVKAKCFSTDSSCLFFRIIQKC